MEHALWIFDRRQIADLKQLVLQNTKEICIKFHLWIHLLHHLKGNGVGYKVNLCMSGTVWIISLIPRLSHRLEYLTFRTISCSCNSSPTISWLPMRYASVYIMHMNPMCVAQSAARGTVKSKLGQWIRINIGSARLKRNLDLISVFHCHCPRAQLLAVHITAHQRQRSTQS